MSIDSITVRAIARELNEKLVPCKIDKIAQPEGDTFIFSVRAQNTNYKLLLASGTGNARAHLTSLSLENPKSPPMFCMLLRKYLQGARLTSVRQPGFERVLIFELDGQDELNYCSHMQLILELTGRNSNLILVDGDGRIIDCLKRVSFAGSSERCLLPGMLYHLPPIKTKDCFWDTDFDRLTAIFTDPDALTPRTILQKISGVSPTILRELQARADRGSDILQEAESMRIAVQMNRFSYCIIYENGIPLECASLDLIQYGALAEKHFFSSVSEMLDQFYSDRTCEESKRRKRKSLYTQVKSLYDRTQRKLLSREEEYQKTETRDNLRREADLIIANIYHIKKGERALKCQDFYSEDLPEVTIYIDPLRDPQENAAIRYKQYNKLKKAHSMLERFILEDREQLRYLGSVLDEIEAADNESDLSAIRFELEETGFIKKQEQKSRKNQKNSGSAKPHRLITQDGAEILVGRNNLQNEELTFRIAKRFDYWFHVQKIHGSHVILCCSDEVPTETMIHAAAVAAAYHSKARGEGKTLVDYTLVRNVRKNNFGYPGNVYYTEQKTIAVSAAEYEKLFTGKG